MDYLVALGYLSSLAVFAYPLTTMRDVKRATSVGERSALPFVAALLTCGVFVLYGLTAPRREALIIRNAMGAPFHAIYTGVFLYYYMPVDRLISLVYIVPGLAGFGTVLGFFMADGLSTAILGYLCTVAGSATALLPFLRLRTVWERKSMEAMPPAVMAALSAANGAIWTYNTFTAIPRDWMTVIPNGAAALSASIQLIMHLVCWIRKPAPVTFAADDTKTPLLPPSTDALEGDARGQDGNLAGGTDSIA